MPIDFFNRLCYHSTISIKNCQYALKTLNIHSNNDLFFEQIDQKVKKEKNMPFYEREDKILDLLATHENISLQELSEKLFISLPTLRRDLLKIEKKGLIFRGHGKVELIKNAADIKIPFALRAQEQNSAKNAIAHAAAAYLKDGCTIMLDASTSAYYMIPLIAEYKNTIVITNGVKTAMLLAEYGIKTICTGGHMINKSYSFVGYETLSLVSRYNADLFFFSCRALSSDGIASDTSVEENDVRRVMIKQSRKNIMLCDERKIGKLCLNNLCTAAELDDIISNAPLPQNIQSMIGKSVR